MEKNVNNLGNPWPELLTHISNHRYKTRLSLVTKIKQKFSI